MNIYLAARYSRREELLAYKADLEAIGHTVPARWLLGEHQVHDGALEVEAATESMPDVARLFAEDDVADLQAADLLIAFSEPPRASGNSRGGRHVEFGMALAWGKPIIIVGPAENVFHTLPQIRRWESWEALMHEDWWDEVNV
ncbi:MAG: nucleoside 2-deoxyribosyltransferase [Candidatus Omnitrophota bacterium]|nr:nucleoside 2-deoxyribosyltransferase [Candidatus Omnitrophota bacterium]